MDKVSIIIPIYKAEAYLPKCIDSILAQTYQNWELILVDDGSPDKSGELCDEYATSDNRIIVLHKRNGGVSSARNCGLARITGDWVLFVDADDWISNECLSTCINFVKTHQLNLVQFGYAKVYENGHTINKKLKLTDVLCGADYIKNGFFNLCVAGSMIDANIILTHNIKFAENIKLAEDQLFLMECIRISERIKYIDKHLYYYYQNSNSATHNQSYEDMKCACFAIISYMQYWPQSRFHFDNLILDFLTSMIESKEAKIKDIHTIYNNANIANYTQNRIKTRLFYYISKVSVTLAFYCVRLFNH